MMQMKKKWAVGLLVACVATAGLAELSIATVDLDKVFTAHPKTKAAEAQLEQAEKAVEAEMEEVAKGLRDLETQVSALREAARNLMLTDEARAAKRAEAEDKLTELQEAQLRARRTQETKLKQLREQLMASRQGIVDELLKEVSAFAEAEGYDLVLDRSGMTMNMVPLAAYSAPELDVTERVIERLKP